MYWDLYAPWVHYPKTLRHEELMNPMGVIAEFFSSDSVPGHERQLREWRYYVINDESYPGGRHGPGNLLFDYDLNLKLLEAVYLLYCHYRNYSYRQAVVGEEQLVLEKSNWSYFPDRLPVEEIRNPYEGVRVVFEQISPQGYRDYLHEWLHSALHFKADVERLTAGNVILVYDNLVKLYSLAWLIYQRGTEHAHQKKDSIEVNNMFDEDLEIGEIRSIDPQPTAAERMGLEAIRKLIVERFPFVEMVVHLGTHRKPFTYFVLILVADGEAVPEHEISNRVEDHCKFLPNVHAIVHKTSSAVFALGSGKRFWCRAMCSGSVLYRSESLELPDNMVISDEVLME